MIYGAMFVTPYKTGVASESTENICLLSRSTGLCLKQSCIILCL